MKIILSRFAGINTQGLEYSELYKNKKSYTNKKKKLTAFCWSLKSLQSFSRSGGTAVPDSSRALIMSPAYRAWSSVIKVYA